MRNIEVNGQGRREDRQEGMKVGEEVKGGRKGGGEKAREVGICMREKGKRKDEWRRRGKGR